MSHHGRQIHLDFHTSPWIDDVGADFDAEAFAEAMEAARVNSVTVFAKCHHGQCYYPTGTGVQHPALKGRDLLGEQLEALKKRGIRCPLYTTVVWEEDVAQRFPQWRQLRKNGTFAEWREGTDHQTIQPGYWKFNDFMNPEYQDYFEAHLRELLDRYSCDGFFIDILFFHREGTWSGACRRLREETGILEDTLEAYYRLEWEAQRRFMEKFNGIIHGLQPGAEIFYNQQNFSWIDSSIGLGSMAFLQSQLEVESLPSGFWGYQHFPRLARQVCTHGKPWLGMTGRFQRQWGDFGGIKPVAALEYECFRAQALGGGCSVGDQLHPRGVPDPAAYRLVGEVYRQIERAEPFYQGTRMDPEVAILNPGHPSLDNAQTDLSLEGAVLMCEENHYDCLVLNDAADLSPYRLLVLPDSVVVTERLRHKLLEYLDGGGNLIASHSSGLDENGDYLFSRFGLEPRGETPDYPTYWKSRESFIKAFSDSPRVIYQAGLHLEAGDGWETLVDRIPPYFRRSDYRFCSHFQTPPRKDSSEFPALVRKDRIAVFSDPVFREYRRYGSVFLRHVWGRVMQDFIGQPAVGAGLPASVHVYPRRKGDDHFITLIHYIPVRKALEIDVIEERQGFAGMVLKVDGLDQPLYDWESGEELDKVPSGGWVLPQRSGRLLVSTRPE